MQYHLIELGKYRAGTIIRSADMTPEEAKAINDKMVFGDVVKWVNDDEEKVELERLTRLGRLTTQSTRPPIAAISESNKPEKSN